jgi:hypothetical protein
MKYRALAEALVPTAEAVRKHFMTAKGVRKFKAEAEVGPSFSYRPTLLGESEDYSLVAIEVNEGVYTDSLGVFVLECLGDGLPISLFVAAPAGGGDAQLMGLVRQAKRKGFGVVEVHGKTVRPLVPALSLSLTGLRPIDYKRFPKASRQRLAQAEETFLNGDPAKGCGRVYDLIELRTRSIAIEIDRLGLWKGSASSKSRPKFNFGKGPWAKLIELVNDYADFAQFPTHGLHIDKALWGRIRGLTPHRNESGHEPSTREELQERNRQLRTRFEHAVDALEALAKASPRILS